MKKVFKRVPRLGTNSLPGVHRQQRYQSVVLNFATYVFAALKPWMAEEQSFKNGCLNRCAFRMRDVYSFVRKMHLRLV